MSGEGLNPPIGGIETQPMDKEPRWSAIEHPEWDMDERKTWTEWEER